MDPDASWPGGGVAEQDVVWSRLPAPTLEYITFGARLDIIVVDKLQMTREIREALIQTQATKNRQRDHINARIARASPGTKAKVGDKALAISTLYNGGLHPKLAHDHFTGRGR